MKIGQIELGITPTIVGTLADQLDLPTEEVESIDLFEIRIDMLPEDKLGNLKELIKTLKVKYRKPLIVTIRSKKEGGILEISDDRRYSIFKDIISEIDIVDVELSSGDLLIKISGLCKENKKILLGSYHNFSETPSEDFLERLTSEGKEKGADIIKIAVQSNSKDDLSELLSFTIKNAKSNLVTISLGNIGLISRIVNPLMGSLMTYGYIDKASSPGQISAFELVEKLRFFDPAYNELLINRLQLLESA